MIDNRKQNLFTIGRVAKACGVTSTTIIDMEKKGFISPVYVDENSGYRYYDDYSVTAILQMQMLHRLGLSMQEAADYFYERTDPKKNLLEMRQFLKTMKYYVNELSLGIPGSPTYYFEFFEVPDILCYTHIGEVMPGPDSDNFGHNILSDAIEAGCIIRYNESLFGIRVEDGVPANYHRIPVKMCIPICEKDVPVIPEIETIPGGKLFSIVFCGLHEAGKDAHSLLFEEIKKRKLKPTGALRAYADVAPYTNYEIPCEQHITRYGILVDQN